ncbi:hypothetical protein [Pseudomonas purpurea]|uniref:hypothetical protein n=1 Tax=Pseudomonas purpurea TaxID=3136737 RepID=UPI003266DF15
MKALRGLLGAMMLLVSASQALADSAVLKRIASCRLGAPDVRIELLRGMDGTHSWVYALRDSGPQHWLYDNAEDSRGGSVHWQCAGSEQGQGVLVLSGEFTSNYLQGAAFYVDPVSHRIERIAFAERNRPRWVMVSERGTYVVFENTGHESSSKYLLYAKDDGYQEVDELPTLSAAKHERMIDLRAWKR